MPKNREIEILEQLREQAPEMYEEAEIVIELMKTPTPNLEIYKKIFGFIEKLANYEEKKRRFNQLRKIFRKNKTCWMGNKTSDEMAELMFGLINGFKEADRFFNEFGVNQK